MGESDEIKESKVKFKPGDKIWFLKGLLYEQLPAGKYKGVVVAVEHTQLMRLFAAVALGLDTRGASFYTITLEDAEPADWCVIEHALEPRHDDYDGDQVGDWDSCPYKPKLEVV
jgi:hypothetical protein